MPVAVLRPAVERLRGLETKIATLEALLEGEIQVSFEVPPEPRWQPLSRWPSSSPWWAWSSPPSGSC